MTRVIAIGTPHGADSIAPELLESVAPELKRLDPDIEITVCESPGSELIQHLDSTSPTLLVDAIVGAGAPLGRVIEVSLEDLDALQRPVSTHDLSVAETLRLADSLGELPRRLRIFGICVEAGNPLPSAARQRAAGDLLERLSARLPSSLGYR